MHRAERTQVGSFFAIGPKNPCYALAPYAPVAQLDRASDYESEGRKFESSRVRKETKSRRESAFLLCGGSGKGFECRGPSLERRCRPQAHEDHYAVVGAALA